MERERGGREEEMMQRRVGGEKDEVREESDRLSSAAANFLFQRFIAYAKRALDTS